MYSRRTRPANWSFWVGTDIDKGVYYALVLTSWNPGKISNICQKQSSGECPVGMLYTTPSLPHSQRCTLYTFGSGKHKEESIYMYRRGVQRCSFRQIGQFQEPQEVKRAAVRGFTSFLCQIWNYTNLTVNVTIDRQKTGFHNNVSCIFIEYKNNKQSSNDVVSNMKM